MDWRGPGGARDDFIILNHQEHAWLRAQGIEPKRVHVKRGDVILWRSDLVHKGAPPIGRRDNFRAVVYVCMLPAAMTPEHVYKEKRTAYEQLQTSCHWPNREEWFRPKRQNGEVQSYFKKPPQLNLRQQQLYGLVRYEVALAHPVRAGERQANATIPSVDGTDCTQPSRKATRRWARNSTCVETQASTAGEPAPESTCSSSAELGNPVEDDCQSACDLRRVRKALREIDTLQAKQGSGEKLRRNQIEKLAKKEMYLCELQSLAPTPCMQGGT